MNYKFQKELSEALKNAGRISENAFLYAHGRPTIATMGNVPPVSAETASEMYDVYVSKTLNPDDEFVRMGKEAFMNSVKLLTVIE